MAASDRRIGGRKPLPKTAMLAHASGVRLCKIHDISLTGALLEVGWGVLTHDVPVQLVVDLPVGDGEKSFSLQARVARVSVLGTAIEFEQLDPDSFKALSGYVIGQQAS